jgi:hypothetical protein
MQVEKKREIVIEIERVRTIRKRCNTHVLFCSECNDEADFITLREAAGLFEIDPDLLTSYAHEHLCHVRPSDSETFLCVPSLLDHMQRRTAALRSGGLSLQSTQLLTD